MAIISTLLVLTLLNIFLFIITITIIGGIMDVLNASIKNLNEQVAAVSAKINALKDNQLDPVVLNAATDAINQASNTLADLAK